MTSVKFKWRANKFFRSVLKITIFVVWLLWLPALSCKIPENDTAYSEMGLKCQEYTRYSKSCTLLNKAKLKGQCHEIFDFRFIFMNQLTPVANLPPVSLKLVVHLALWISPQIFDKKFEMILLLFSGAVGKMIKKNVKHKTSWHCPFKKEFGATLHFLVPQCINDVLFAVNDGFSLHSLSRYCTSSIEPMIANVQYSGLSIVFPLHLFNRWTQRVDRVLGFFSSRPNWDPPPPPHPQASVSHFWFRGGGNTLACGRGGGGFPIRTRGQTLWCSRYIKLYTYFVVLDITYCDWLNFFERLLFAPPFVCSCVVANKDCFVTVHYIKLFLYLDQAQHPGPVATWDPGNRSTRYNIPQKICKNFKCGLKLLNVL
jgi:hypothetical protein